MIPQGSTGDSDMEGLEDDPFKRSFKMYQIRVPNLKKRLYFHILSHSCWIYLFHGNMFKSWILVVAMFNTTLPKWHIKTIAFYILRVSNIYPQNLALKEHCVVILSRFMNITCWKLFNFKPWWWTKAPTIYHSYIKAMITTNKVLTYLHGNSEMVNLKVFYPWKVRK